VLGEYFLKTSPSGGARHPVEVYPLVLRVETLEPGVYHYSVRNDALRRVRAGLHEDELVRAFAGFRWFADAPIAFVMTAVLERSMWKYRHSHAYRVLLLDAGHLGQTFHLICTELGLAPFTSAALNDAFIEDLLGLDVSREVALYGAATGWPLKTDG
jgi:SagB-type dehydrogenase family enzyme